MSDDLDKQVYSEAEAAVRLGISKPTLLRLRAEGRIGYYRIGSRVVYSEADHIRPFLAACHLARRGNVAATRAPQARGEASALPTDALPTERLTAALARLRAAVDEVGEGTPHFDDIKEEVGRRVSLRLAAGLIDLAAGLLDLELAPNERVLSEEEN